MTFPALFALVVGVLMLVQWTFFLLSGNVPELKDKPAEIWLHIAGEMMTALSLLIAGIGMLTGAVWSVAAYLVATGMLLYTLVVSPGYYVQRRVWPLVGMFAVLLVLALVSLGVVVNGALAG